MEVLQMPLIEFEQVGKVYDRPGRFGELSRGRDGGGIRALDKISFTVDRGQALGIVGESGAGKTTLASLIAGLDSPSSGRLIIEGSPRIGRDNRMQRAAMIQFVWQDVMDSIDPRYTVQNVISEPLKIHGLAQGSGLRDRVNALLGEVGLGQELLERYPHELSGGQAQRVVIARALAMDPTLVVCDEPASALDVQAKSQIADLLMRLRSQRDLAYVIIAHDLSLVRKMTDSLIVMYRGRILESGPTGEVLESPRHPYTRQLVSAESLTIEAPDLASYEKAGVTVSHSGVGDKCIFSDRCPQVMDICLKEDVRLVTTDGHRMTACLLYKGQIPR
jgi:oligopeptide/dipeptide ABC transporter ATP-binding protein